MGPGYNLPSAPFLIVWAGETRRIYPKRNSIAAREKNLWSISSLTNAHLLSDSGISGFLVLIGVCLLAILHVLNGVFVIIALHPRHGRAKESLYGSSHNPFSET